MDKDNEYAGKQESRPVDAKVSETESDLTFAGSGAHHVKSSHIFSQSFPLEPR